MFYKNGLCGACALFLLATNAQAATTNRRAMTAPAGTPTNTVVIKSFMFMPMTLTIPAGTTVTWQNLDGEPHTAVSIDGLFRSPALDENDTYSFKFDKAGTYKFLCSIHPQMRGTIVVTAK